MKSYPLLIAETVSMFEGPFDAHVYFVLAGCFCFQGISGSEMQVALQCCSRNVDSLCSAAPSP